MGSCTNTNSDILFDHAAIQSFMISSPTNAHIPSDSEITAFDLTELFNLIIKEGNQYYQMANESGLIITGGSGWNFIQLCKQESWSTYKAGEHFLRVAKVGTLLAPSPVIAKGAQAALDSGSQIFAISHETSPQGRDPSWKRHVFNLSLATLSLIGSMFVLGNAADLIEDDNYAYTAAKYGATASMVTSIGTTIAEKAWRLLQ